MLKAICGQAGRQVSERRREQAGRIGTILGPLDTERVGEAINTC